ncbi:hypothetical protein [Kaarinaea lacus]
MNKTLLPQLEDPEAREAVAEAVMALFARWDLHEVNQAQLLSISSIIGFRKKILQADSNTMERAGYLLAIDRALLKRFPSQMEKRDRWVFTPNKNLDGLTPLSVMLDNGVPGMEVIKMLAESRSQRL